ncbi:MAG: hypothetical protein ACKV2U_09330, partial [Bryobacteraceae bacterium]
MPINRLATGALNQDNTINSESDTKLPGTVIQLFGTGLGVTPAQPGVPFSAAALYPLRKPAVISIGGHPAEIPYLGGG